MMFRKSAPAGTPLAPMTYAFLEPVRVSIRHPDGRVVLTGFGVGEQVQVMEPRVQNLVVCTEVLPEIPLADGSAIVEWPASMRYQRVWK